MGCMSCKHTDEIINPSPHMSKRESRWRFVAGIEAKVWNLMYNLD